VITAIGVLLEMGDCISLGFELKCDTCNLSDVHDWTNEYIILRSQHFFGFYTLVKKSHLFVLLRLLIFKKITI